MATFNPDLVDGVASETIVKGQFVKYASGGWDACDTAGEQAHGIAFSDADSGDALCVQVGKLCVYKVGAANIADGADIAVDANGLGITAVTGDYVRAKAIGAAVAGAYGTALWFDGFIYDGT